MRTAEETEALEARVQERWLRHKRRVERHEWWTSEMPERVAAKRWVDGGLALLTLWLLFAVPGLMIGWFRGDAEQGLRMGTTAYGLMIGCGILYGMRKRRS